MNASIRFEKRFCRNGRWLALLGLLGIACALTCAGPARAQAPAQRPPAHLRPTHQPHQATTPASDPQQPHADQPRTPRAHVYLLRGLWDIFSRGMDKLAEELNQRGVETTVENHSEWETLTEQAAARYKAGSENPIILIGHSFGADAVMDMAAALGRKDVPVALVIPFDGTEALIAPENVARVVNITQRAYEYVRPGAGFHGSITNVDVGFDEEIDHYNIEKSARTHARAISEVMAVVGDPSPNSAGPTPAPVDKAPSVVPSASRTWRGTYVGAQFGWAGSDSHYTYNNGAGTIESFSFDPRSAIDGGHMGVQWQWSSWVLGVEGSFSATNLNQTDASALLTGESRRLKIDDIGTLVGKVGYARDNWLLYAKAGWAGGRISTEDINSGIVQVRAWDNSWTVGTGVDYVFSQGWPAKFIAGVDLNYYNFKFDRSATAFGGATPNWFDTNSHIYAVMARLSFLFSRY